MRGIRESRPSATGALETLIAGGAPEDGGTSNDEGDGGGGSGGESGGDGAGGVGEGGTDAGGADEAITDEQLSGLYSRISVMREREVEVRLCS